MPYARIQYWLRRFLLCAATVATLLAARANAQTSQPQPSLIDPWPPFEESLAAVRKHPLLQAEDKVDLEGKPLTDAKLKDAEKATKLLEESNMLRQKADFANALPKAREALRIRMAIYGSAHFHTVTALAAEKTLARYVASPPAEMSDLADSDRAQLKAEAAYDKSDYANAINLASKALGIRERILGRGHHELGECYRIIGSAQTELSQMKEAELSLSRGVESTEKAYGKMHPMLARILDRQGWLYFNIGDLAKALSSHQTAVRIYGLTTGDTLDSAEACDNLGTVLALRGDYDDALNYKIRALVVREAISGPDSKDVGISYSNLAWLYTRLGVEAQVVPLRQKALAIFQKLLGPDHPYTTTETVNLGVNLQNLKRVDEAIALFKQAVDADEKRAAPVDALVVSRITRLGTATFEAGRRNDADKVLKTALEKAKEVKKLGNARGAANEVKMIADVYDAYRMYDSGIAALQEAAKWDDPAAPDDGTIVRGQMLGNMLVAVGQQSEGRDLLKKTVESANKMYGVGDRRTAATLMALAVAYERCGDLAAAERVCDQVLKISESKFGAESKANAIALRQMGRIYLLQKKIDLARFSLDDCKKIVEKYQEYEQVEMIRTLHEYAELQIAEGKRADAVKSLRDAQDRCKKLFEKTNTPHLDGLTAKTLKKLLDAIGSDTPPDKDAIRSELRTILNRLKEGRGLDAENRQWLSELDGK